MKQLIKIDRELPDNIQELAEFIIFGEKMLEAQRIYLEGIKERDVSVQYILSNTLSIPERKLPNVLIRLFANST